MVDSIQAKLELSFDTPAVNYVKAAVALRQKNQKEAKDWIGVAEKNLSPQVNKLFAESLYEVGWLEKPAGVVDLRCRWVSPQSARFQKARTAQKQAINIPNTDYPNRQQMEQSIELYWHRKRYREP